MTKPNYTLHTEQHDQTPLAAFRVLPPLAVTRAEVSRGRRLLMRSLVWALVGSVGLAGLSPVLGRDAKAKETAAVPSAQQTNKKSRKTEPTEAMGINLSIESKEAEVKADSSASSSSRQAKPAQKKEEAVTPMADPQPRKVSSRKTTVRKAGVRKVEKLKVEASKKKAQKPVGVSAKLVPQKGPSPEELKAALAGYDEVLKKERNNAEAIKGKAMILAQMSAEPALEALDEMADVYPRVAIVHASRARALSDRNDTLEALKAWKKALALEPKNKDFQVGLAMLNKRLDDEARALRLRPTESGE